jgi:hypothetical protein
VELRRGDVRTGLLGHGRAGFPQHLGHGEHPVAHAGVDGGHGVVRPDRDAPFRDGASQGGQTHLKASGLEGVRSGQHVQGRAQVPGGAGQGADDREVRAGELAGHPVPA